MAHPESPRLAAPETGALAATEDATVLQVEGVTYVCPRSDEPLLIDTDVTITRGEVVIGEVSPACRIRSLASLLMGLDQPSVGHVRLRQLDWADQSFRQQDRMRGRIGRIFEHSAWLENLNIIDNVCLASQHRGVNTEHTMRRLRIMAEQLKLDGLNYDRPGLVSRPLRQIYQWIRAFIGDPELLLLERPLAMVPQDRVNILMEMLAAQCKRGAAVLWLTSDSVRDSAALAALTPRSIALRTAQHGAPPHRAPRPASTPAPSDSSVSESGRQPTPREPSPRRPESS